MYCDVIGCRFRGFHTTRGHRCGICNEYGHGQVECDNFTLMRRLRSMADKEIPMLQRCTVWGCVYSSFHTTAGHFCVKCRKYGHSSRICGLESNWRMRCVMCRSMSNVDINSKVFTNAECVVCTEKKPLLVFQECRHAVVCYECSMEYTERNP